MTQATYKQLWNSYPIGVAEDGLGFEGAMNRFRAFPTPNDVFKMALLGLPKTLTLTNEVLVPDDCAVFLENAITEIEMSMNMDITPVDRFSSHDYIDGMFESNFSGLRLPRWPAYQIRYMMMKFPHTQTIPKIIGDDNPQQTGPQNPNSYQTYTIPPGWVSLRNNTVNVVAAFGTVTVSTDQSAIASAGGIFNYITGFGRGAYQPAMIEVAYSSGFVNDRMPNSVHDLIVTLATIRFLENIFPVLIPYQNVSASIDGVSQSATINIHQLLIQRIGFLQAQFKKKASAIYGNFGKNMKFTFIGS